MTDLNGAVILGGNGSPAFISRWCNPFGFETGGAKTYLGAPVPGGAKVTQWNCKKRSIGRFRIRCAHGHQGQIMELCEDHARQFKSRKMTFCPTCNRTSDHKCDLSLTEIS